MQYRTVRKAASELFEEAMFKVGVTLAVASAIIGLPSHAQGWGGALQGLGAAMQIEADRRDAADAAAADFERQKELLRLQHQYDMERIKAQQAPPSPAAQPTTFQRSFTPIVPPEMVAQRTAELDRSVPGWRAVGMSKEFNDWFVTQPTIWTAPANRGEVTAIGYLVRTFQQSRRERAQP